MVCILLRSGGKTHPASNSNSSSKRQALFADLSLLRNRLLRKFNKNKSITTWEKYKRQRNLTTSLIRKSKSQFNRKLNADLNNPELCVKKWWSIAKSLTKGRIDSSVPALMENKNVISDPKEKATILNDFFTEQTNLDISSAALPPMNFIQTRKFLSTVITSKEEVFNLLNSVNIAKTYGYDGIGNRILKRHLIFFLYSYQHIPGTWRFPGFMEVRQCCSFVQKREQANKDKLSSNFPSCFLI